MTMTGLMSVQMGGGSSYVKLMEYMKIDITQGQLGIICSCSLTCDHFAALSLEVDV